MLMTNSNKVLFGVTLTAIAACGYLSGQIPDVRVVKTVMMFGSAVAINGSANSIKTFCLKAHAAFLELHRFEGAGENPEGVPQF